MPVKMPSNAPVHYHWPVIDPMVLPVIMASTTPMPAPVLAVMSVAFMSSVAAGVGPARPQCRSSRWSAGLGTGDCGEDGCCCLAGDVGGVVGCLGDEVGDAVEHVADESCGGVGVQA